MKSRHPSSFSLISALEFETLIRLLVSTVRTIFMPPLATYRHRAGQPLRASRPPSRRENHLEADRTPPTASQLSPVSQFSHQSGGESLPGLKTPSLKGDHEGSWQAPTQGQELPLITESPEEIYWDAPETPARARVLGAFNPIEEACQPPPLSSGSSSDDESDLDPCPTPPTGLVADPMEAMRTAEEMEEFDSMEFEEIGSMEEVKKIGGEVICETPLIPESDHTSNSAPKSSGSGFELFSRLPPELRDLVWEQSVRHREPGVQYFTIGFPVTTYVLSVPESMEMLVWHPEAQRYSPATGRLLDMIRPVTRQSTSYSDWGIRTACKESHVARRRILNKMQKRYPECRISMLPYWDMDSGAFRQAEVMTARDLFFLVLPHTFNEYLDWQDTFASEDRPQSYQSGRLFQRIECSYDGEACMGPLFGMPVMHIAIAFDEAWVSEAHRRGWQLNRHIFEVFLHSAFQDNGIENLWFVDYSLRRKPRPTTRAEAEARVFYAGDRTFTEVEVTPTGMGCWVNDLKPYPGFYDSVWFIRALRFLMKHHFSVSEDAMIPFNVGLLACEFKNSNSGDNNNNKERR